MKDAYLDLLLRIRKTQPAEWELLDPEEKLRALEYEAERRGRELFDEENEKPQAA